MKLNMRKLRKEKGMTQTELGNCVSATTRQIGADALDCTIDELVNRPDFDSPRLHHFEQSLLQVIAEYFDDIE